MYLIILLLIILIVLLSLAFFVAMQFFNMLFHGYAPYLSTNGKIIEKILTEVNLQTGSQAYELGCGNAGLSFTLEKKFPGIKIKAYEYSFLPFFFTKLRIIFKNSKVKISKTNFFKINFKEADLLYCYLNIGTMKKLEEKIRNECKPGARIISYRFSFPNIPLEKIVVVDEEKIYFYTV